MTVRELINILENFDDNIEVRVQDGDWAEPIDDVDIYNGMVVIRNLWTY